MKVAACLGLALLLSACSCGGGPPEGAFRGQIEHPGLGSYEVAISLTEAKVGQPSGSVEYTSKRCWADLVFIEAQEDRFVYRESAVLLSPETQTKTGSVAPSGDHQATQCSSGRKLIIQATDDSHILARWDDGAVFGRLAPFEPPPHLEEPEAIKLIAKATSGVASECANERGLEIWSYSKKNTRLGVAPFPYGDTTRSFYILLRVNYSGSNDQNLRKYHKGRACIRSLEQAGLVERSEEIPNIRRDRYGNHRDSRATRFLWRGKSGSGVRLARTSSFHYLARGLAISPCGGVNILQISGYKTWTVSSAGFYDWEFENPYLQKLQDCAIQPSLRCGKRSGSKQIPLKGRHQVDFIHERGTWRISHLDAPFLCQEQSGSHK